MRSEFVQRCVDRLKKADIQCTMSATTPEELVQPPLLQSITVFERHHTGWR
jgi:hypothetical protein